VVVRVDDGAVLLDIDTPQMLDRQPEAVRRGKNTT
jgi:hypothetical protein